MCVCVGIPSSIKFLTSGGVEMKVVLELRHREHDLENLTLHFT